MSIQNMPQHRAAIEAQPSEQMIVSSVVDEELSLFDLWWILVRYRKLVLGLPVLIGLIATAAVSLMKPVREGLPSSRSGWWGRVAADRVP